MITFLWLWCFVKDFIFKPQKSFCWFCLYYFNHSYYFCKYLYCQL